MFIFCVKTDKMWQTWGEGLCISETVNKCPVGLWNESAHCLLHLVPSKYLSKNKLNTRRSLFASTLFPPSPPPDVWTKTNRTGANAGRKPRQAHRGLVYYCSACWTLEFPSQRYKRCHRVQHSSIRWNSPDMAHLTLPVFLVLSFSLLCCSRPSRSRKAVSSRQSGGSNMLFLNNVMVYHLTSFIIFVFVGQLERMMMWRLR